MESSSKPGAGRVISIMSPMGGDGRTTLSANVGAALAKLGKETITVDADIVQRQLSMVMGLEHRTSFSLVDVMEEACDLSKACIRHRDVAGLQILPIARHVQDMLVMENMKPGPEVVRRACDELRPLADFIVIDTPPGYSGGLEMASAADELIVVVMPRWHSVRAAEHLVEHAKLRDRYNMCLVINHMPSEKGQRCDGILNADEVSEILQLDLLGIVPEDDYVTVSSHRGEFAALNPESAAGRGYQNVARRLLDEGVLFKSEEPFGTSS